MTTRAHSRTKRRPREEVILFRRQRQRLPGQEVGRRRTRWQVRYPEEFIPRRRDPIGAPSLPRTTAAAGMVFLVGVTRFHGNVLCGEDSAQIFPAADLPKVLLVASETFGRLWAGSGERRIGELMKKLGGTTNAELREGIDNAQFHRVVQMRLPQRPSIGSGIRRVGNRFSNR